MPYMFSEICYHQIFGGPSSYVKIKLHMICIHNLCWVK